MFYCRENELIKLNNQHKGDYLECIIIYIKQSVGKAILNK